MSNEGIGPGQMSAEELEPSFSRDANEKKIDWNEQHRLEKERKAHLTDILETAKPLEFHVNDIKFDQIPFIDYFIRNVETNTDPETGEKHYYQLYKLEIEQRLTNTFSSAEDISDLADALEEIELPEIEEEAAEVEEKLDRIPDYVKSKERERLSKELIALNDKINKFPFLIQFLREM